MQQTHNLKDNRAATVTIEGDTWHATARLATPIEREEIWTSGDKIYPGLREGGSVGRRPPHRGVRPHPKLM
jgi:hypothetical protein